MLQMKIKQNNPKWPYIVDHPYRILIIGGSGSGKTNALLNLINQQGRNNCNIIDQIYLYVKDPHKPKYQYLINKRGKIGQYHFVDPQDIEYSNDMRDVCKNIDIKILKK